jgi:putative two-component system response regulator
MRMLMGPRGIVLVVDDDDSVRQLLVTCLRLEGYDVLAAGNGRAALDLLTNQPCDLVVADVRMPGMDGIDLLSEIRMRRIPVGVLMLTACDDVPIAVNAMKLGALDYILKPFEVADLRQRISAAMSQKVFRSVPETHGNSAPPVEELRTALDEQTRQMLSMLRQLDEASESMLEALVTALDAREHETHSHSLRVAHAAEALAFQMGYNGQFLKVLRRGALLHDIGKIGVADKVLLKPGELSAEDWVEMRRHPSIGARILESVELLRPAAELVLCHHERFDGTGYPRGLGGAAIPIGARIFSLVDSWDAMISPRSYRTKLTLEQARDEIKRCSGSQFDPEVVESYLTLPEDLFSDSSR